MKNVLVSGGAGFIGSNFIHYLLKQEQVQVINLDALTYSGNTNNLAELPDNSRHTFIHGDICDQYLLDKIFIDYKIDTVVHFAAESHVDRSIVNSSPFVSTNVSGTVHMLEAAKKAWTQERKVGLKENCFLHISTDEVYGSLKPSEPPFKETNSYRPNSPYAASKAASDHFARSYFSTFGLPVKITNCSNNYGPRQYPEKLIPLILFNALEGKSLPLYGDGKQVRDWLYVEDHCEALLLVLRHGKLGETYNIGGKNQVTNLELVLQLCEILEEYAPRNGLVPYSNSIEFIHDRPGHDRRYAVDITKINSELGWKPNTSLESGLRTTVAWYLENSKWLRKVANEPVFKSWIHNNYETP